MSVTEYKARARAIRAGRTFAKMSQMSLAKALGVGQTIVSRIERAWLPDSKASVYMFQHADRAFRLICKRLAHDEDALRVVTYLDQGDS